MNCSFSSVVNVRNPDAPSCFGSHPWKVFTRPKAYSPGEYEAKVYLESSVLDSLRPDDRITITGLDTWFDLIANDAIWLGIIFDSAGEVTSASIDSWGQGDSFSPVDLAWQTDAYVTDDGADPPVHQASRVLLAYTVAGDLGEPILTQCANTHFILRNVCIDGRGARFAFPSPYAPYVV